MSFIFRNAGRCYRRDVGGSAGPTGTGTFVLLSKEQPSGCGRQLAAWVLHEVTRRGRREARACPAPSVSSTCCICASPFGHSVQPTPNEISQENSSPVMPTPLRQLPLAFPEGKGKASVPLNSCYPASGVWEPLFHLGVGSKTLAPSPPWTSVT